MANSNKILNTRICLKYDSWANWDSIKDTFTPLTGEVCVVNPGTATGSLANTPCLMKVGDGETLFSQLPWVSAPAADVHEWAKKPNPDWADFPALPITVDDTGSGKFVTDLAYTDNKLAITRADVNWTDINNKEIIRSAGPFTDEYNPELTVIDIEFTDNQHLFFYGDEVKLQYSTLYGGNPTIGIELSDDFHANINEIKTNVNTLKGSDEGKSARAIATEVAKAEIGSAGHLKREIVTELPDVEDADADTIYMKRVLGDSVQYSYEESQYVNCDSPEDMLVGEDWTPSAFDWEPVDHLMPFGQGDYGSTWIHVTEPGRYFLACEGIYNLYIYGYTTETSGLNVLYNTFISTPGGYIVEVPIGYVSITGNTKNCTGVYRIPNEDRFIEYMLIEGAFEKIGDTAVNLDGYATEDWIGDNFLENIILFTEGGDDYVAGAITTKVDNFTRQETGTVGKSKNLFVGLKKGGVIAEALADKAVTKFKLSTEVQESLDRADTAFQELNENTSYFQESDPVVSNALSVTHSYEGIYAIGIRKEGIATEALADGAVTEAKLETALAEKINNPSILDLEDMSGNTTDYVIFNCGSATTLI